MKTEGKVLSVSKQWWFKVNTKMVRKGSLDGATFPHILKVSYVVDGITYTKRKWISAGKEVPAVGDVVHITYDERNPKKIEITY